MALDQVEVMKSFGFDAFRLVGQDRGGRVSHRLALDHPERVTSSPSSTSYPRITSILM